MSADCDAADSALGALANARRASCSRINLASRGMAMKPAPFDYQAPGTLREAVDLLASNPEASIIARGAVSNHLAMTMVMSLSFRKKPSVDGRAGSYQPLLVIRLNMRSAGVHRARTLT